MSRTRLSAKRSTRNKKFKVNFNKLSEELARAALSMVSHHHSSTILSRCHKYLYFSCVCVRASSTFPKRPPNRILSIKWYTEAAARTFWSIKTVCQSGDSASGASYTHRPPLRCQPAATETRLWNEKKKKTKSQRAISSKTRSRHRLHGHLAIFFESLQSIKIKFKDNKIQ